MLIKCRSTGGATVTTPAKGWADPDLPVYFTRKYTPSTRTATRSIPPTGTASSTTVPAPPAPHHTDTGAIAGGIVGGAVVLIGCIALAIFCLRRQKQKRNPTPSDHQTQPVPPMAELPNSNPTAPHSPNDMHKVQSNLSPATAYSYPSTSPHAAPAPLYRTPTSELPSDFPYTPPDGPAWQPQPYYPPPAAHGWEPSRDHTPPQYSSIHRSPQQLRAEMPGVSSPVGVHAGQRGRGRNMSYELPGHGSAEAGREPSIDVRPV